MDLLNIGNMKPCLVTGMKCEYYVIEFNISKFVITNFKSRYQDIFSNLSSIETNLLI